MPYATWLTKLVPGWLQNQWGGRFVKALGDELDEISAELVQAARAPMPGASLSTAAATENLALIAQERQLERGPVETNATYAERLRLAWDTWKEAGSHPALLKQLDIAGFDRPNLYIIQKSGKRTTLTTPTSMTVVQGPVWTMDAKPAKAYASFGLFFTAAQVDLTWSAAAGFSDRAALLHRIARRWKPAKAEFWGTQIMGTGATYGWPSTRTWGTFTWGGAGGVYLPPT